MTEDMIFISAPGPHIIHEMPYDESPAIGIITGGNFLKKINSSLVNMMGYYCVITDDGEEGYIRMSFAVDCEFPYEAIRELWDKFMNCEINIFGEKEIGMSMMKRYLEEMVSKYLETHPNLTWDEAMEILCSGGDEKNENSKE